MAHPSDAQLAVEALREHLDAEAAGLWILRGEVLHRAAFEPSARLPMDVARDFEDRTRVVGLDQKKLGIVQAATTNAVVEMLVGGPDAEGSPRWLQKFTAQRSIVAPLRDSRGQVFAVAAVALRADKMPTEQVAEAIQQHMQRWAQGQLESGPEAE